MGSPKLGGRKAEAARNDGRILAAAREVFFADPASPVAAVAKRAGVGISALYRRYENKEALLRTLCAEGLRLYIAHAEAALADEGDPWVAFVAFMRRIVEADTHALTVRLAGTFPPGPALFRDAERAHELNVRLVERTRAAGAIRPDFEVLDMALIFEQIAAIRFGDAARTTRLRERYLVLALDGLRTPNPTPLPGPAPTGAELGARWDR